MASVYKKTQKNAETEKKYREAIDIRRELASHNSEMYIFVGESQYNLALLYEEHEQYDDAIKMYEEACISFGKMTDRLEESQGYLASGLVKIAEIEKKRKHYHEAEHYYQDAVKIYNTFIEKGIERYKEKTNQIELILLELKKK